MSFALFFERFGDIAAEETRVLTVPEGNKLLPPGEYGLLEMYCQEKACDCRRVIFRVARSDRPDRTLATVNFGWETPGFYGKWLGTPDGAEELAGASLESMGPQSKHSEALLALCEYALQDKSYLERIKRHYRMFRKSVEARQS